MDGCGSMAGRTGDRGGRVGWREPSGLGTQDESMGEHVTQAKLIVEILPADPFRGPSREGVLRAVFGPLFLCVFDAACVHQDLF